MVALANRMVAAAKTMVNTANRMVEIVRPNDFNPPISEVSSHISFQVYDDAFVTPTQAEIIVAPKKDQDSGSAGLIPVPSANLSAELPPILHGCPRPELSYHTGKTSDMVIR